MGHFLKKNYKCLVGNSLVGRILILRPFRDRSRKGDHMYHSHTVLSHDSTAILVSQNNEMAAMLVSQTIPMGLELFYYANTFFRSNKFACWSRGWKRCIRTSTFPIMHLICAHPQILHNRSFLLGINSRPKRNKKQCLYKFCFFGGGVGGKLIPWPWEIWVRD